MYLDYIGKLMDGAIKAMRFFKTEFQIDIKNEEFYWISPLSQRVRSYLICLLLELTKKTKTKTKTKPKTIQTPNDQKLY